MRRQPRCVPTLPALHPPCLPCSVSNVGDVVPLGLPPALMGYQHVGQLVTLTDGSCRVDSPMGQGGCGRGRGGVDDAKDRAGCPKPHRSLLKQGSMLKRGSGAEEMDVCGAVPGLHRVTASEAGACRDAIFPYVAQFCATPEDQLGGKDLAQTLYNQFMHNLLCGPLWEGVTKPSLLANPNWCCMFEYGERRMPEPPLPPRCSCSCTAHCPRSQVLPLNPAPRPASARGAMYRLQRSSKRAASWTTW